MLVVLLSGDVSHSNDDDSDDDSDDELGVDPETIWTHEQYKLMVDYFDILEAYVM